MAAYGIARFFHLINVEEREDIIRITGIPADTMADDIAKVWKTSKIVSNMFSNIGQNHLFFPKFFAVEVSYILTDLVEQVTRHTSKSILRTIIKLLLEKTWLKNAQIPHPELLDFNQLDRMAWKPKPHQIGFLKTFSTEVPRLNLNGYILASAPGCLVGNTEICFNRGGKGFTLSIAKAHRHFNQLGSDKENWDLTVSTYVRSFTGTRIQLHKINNIVYSGIKKTCGVVLEDGTQLFCTYDHKILTDQGYIAAQDIVGHNVMCDQKDAYKHFGQEVPRFVKATHITPLGFQHTYDICCEAPHHNFVANGIVVHNSGKTFMDLSLLVCLGNKAKVKIIISPKNALNLVWHATITDPEKTAFRVPPTAWYSNVPGEAPMDVEFAVFHYEALERALDLGRKLTAAQVPFSVCVDECHNFNEMSAQRTRNLIELCLLQKKAYHVWASGSPIKALGTEAIPLLRSIDPLFTPDVMERYRKIFGGDAKRANEILQHRLSRVMFKVAKDVVISDKPLVITRKIKLQNSKKYTTESVREEMRAFIEQRMRFYQGTMKAHKELFQKCLDAYEKTLKSRAEILEFATYKNYVIQISKGYDARSMGNLAKYCRNLEKTKILPKLPAELRKEFKKSHSVVKYVSLKVQGEALGTILGARRAECASELARNCGLEEIIENSEAKTLVFASYVSTVTSAMEYLIDKNLHPLQVSADTNAQLTQIVASFDSNPLINPLCATYKSLSTAVPLIMANTVVMLDKPVRQYMYDQTVSRVSRMGQTRQVYVYEILLDTGEEGNVSTRADDIINWSRNQVAAIVGEEFSGNDIDVLTDNFSDPHNKEVHRALSPSHESLFAWDNAVNSLKRLIR